MDGTSWIRRDPHQQLSVDTRCRTFSMVGMMAGSPLIAKVVEIIVTSSWHSFCLAFHLKSNLICSSELLSLNLESAGSVFSPSNQRLAAQNISYSYVCARSLPNQTVHEFKVPDITRISPGISVK